MTVCPEAKYDLRMNSCDHILSIIRYPLDHISPEAVWPIFETVFSGAVHL